MDRYTLWPKIRTMAALEVSQMLYNMTQMFYFVHKRLRSTIQPFMNFYHIVHMSRKINCLQDVYCFIKFDVGLSSENYGRVAQNLGSTLSYYITYM